MDERYSATGSEGASETPDATPPNTALALREVHELLALLAPSADAGLLLDALRAERAGAPLDATRHPAGRELKRVRAQLAMGESSRHLQHALNNPLTALLAEAQMLEMESLSDEQRAAVGRMIDLGRRLSALVRGLDAPGTMRVG